MVESVEELAAGFKARLFRDRKLPYHAQVHGLLAGAVDGVTAHVAVCVSRGSGERRRVEPGIGIARAGPENGLAG